MFPMILWAKASARCRRNAAAVKYGRFHLFIYFTVLLYVLSMLLYALIILYNDAVEFKINFVKNIIIKR